MKRKAASIIISVVLLSALTIAVFYAILFSADFSYFVLYKFAAKPKGKFADFAIEFFLYVTYILPYVLAFANLAILFLRNKAIIRIILFIAYFAFIFLYWGRLIVSAWPYRAMPILLVLTVFYALDILLARVIVKKLLLRRSCI